MEIEELELEVKVYNRLKKAGINTTDELLTEMYKGSSDIKVSAPDAKRCEEALKAVGIIKYVRGDYVTEDDIEPEPLTWDELHNYIGQLVVFDCSTESHKWLKVNWIYDMQDAGEGTVICSDGSRDYSYIRRSQVNGDYSRDPEFLKTHECLKYEGRFFALKSEEVKTVSKTQIMSADYTKAVALTKRIKANAAAAQESLWEVCKGLKEMHDSKLYKELGYSKFEEYAKNEVGFQKVQAYKYVAIASAEIVQSTEHFEAIGTEKLSILAKLDEPQREEIKQTVDLENTSVKELKAKIDDLRKANDRLMAKVDEAEKKADVSRKSERSACEKLSILHTESEMKQTRIEQLESQNAALETQVLELESRPVDVAVQVVPDDKEIDRLTAQFHEELEKRDKDTERQLEELRQHYRQKLSEQRDRLTKEAEQANVDVEEEIAEKAELECTIKFATDALRRLARYVMSIDTDDKAYARYAIKKVDEVYDILRKFEEEK